MRQRLEDHKNSKEIFESYVLNHKKLYDPTFMVGGLCASPFTAILAQLALIDFTGTTAILGGIALSAASFITTFGIGHGADIHKLNKIGQRTIEMKNFAGQTVRGKTKDVIALHALQEKIIYYLEKDYSKRAIDIMTDKMKEITPAVECHNGLSYRIIKTPYDIKQFGLEAHVKELQGFSKPEYKQLFKTPKAKGLKR